VRTAADGDEALRLLENSESPVDLVITDLMMPGMSGRTLAERFGQTLPALKVVYMSGYADDAIVRHGMLADRAPFLSKPFTAEELLRKVREVLQPP
jgi:two-component system, cell cycle sensor histidine kinase and response regulator CckA